MTQSTEPSTIWLTQDAFDKLQAELEDLKGPVRQEIIARISAARDEGDLKENGGYHAAKDEQGKIEGRIRQLEDMLRRAEVGETPADDGVVEPGMVVTYKFVGDADDEAETFLLGAREIEDPTAASRSTRPQSPLGSAIIGKRRATRSPTRRPTARTSRSRSSTRCPSPADPLDSTRLAVSALLGDAVAALAQPGRAPARRAARRGSRAAGAPRPRRGAATARSARARPRARSRRPRPTSVSSCGQAAGHVGDVDPQVEVAAGRGHAVPDHLAEQQRVDVAAGQHRDRPGSRTPSGASSSAATAAAPAGSTTILARSSSASSARDIDSSETVTISST